MRAAPLTAVSLAALVAVSGCSDSKSSPSEDGEGEAQQMGSEASNSSTAEASESAEEASEDLPTDDDLEVFAEALGSNDVATLEDARSLVVESSVADAYLTYQGHLAQSLVDAGMADLASETVESTEDGSEICLESDPNDCALIADFSGSEGKVQDFTVDGKDLDDRIVVGPGESAVGDQGSEVAPVIAYKAASSDTLVVGYDLASSETPIMAATSKYRGPDGRESESSSNIGSIDLSAESMASQVVSFPGAELGGELTVEVLYESTMRPTEITVPIEAE